MSAGAENVGSGGIDAADAGVTGDEDDEEEEEVVTEAMALATRLLIWVSRPFTVDDLTAGDD